ncbi:MAG: FAD-dependent monooxygenase [Pseudomonadota bacterium]
MRLAGRDFIVVGAGISGLASAIALAQRGAEVRLYEQAFALTEVGAGLQIGPNAVAVLEALGLRDAAEQVASLPEAIELRDLQTEKLVTRLELGQVCVARYGRPYWHFHRADLLEVLADGAKEAGVDIRLGERVSSSTPLDERDRCRVELENGTTDEASCIVAADGLRSAMRRNHFSDRAARFTGHVAWRGVVDERNLPAGLLPKSACVFMAPKRHFVTYLLRGGTLRNFVAVEQREDWAVEGWMELDDPENLRRAFAKSGPRVSAILDAVETTFLWGLFDHPPMESWVSGHLALVGDACHPTLPFLAQGAAMGLEDAWVLGAELATAQDISTGLHAFESRRKPRATRIQRASAQAGRIYHLPAGVRSLAHLGMSAMSIVRPTAMLGKFDWLYGADLVSAQASH